MRNILTGLLALTIVVGPSLSFAETTAPATAPASTPVAAPVAAPTPVAGGVVSPPVHTDNAKAAEHLKVEDTKKKDGVKDEGKKEDVVKDSTTGATSTPKAY